MDTLLLVISNKQDRKLLADLLLPHYSIIESQRISENEEFFDLCIIDAVSLEREWNEISLLRNRADLIFLPFLLLTTRQDVGMSTRNLWQYIDDIIFVPIEKIELQSRLVNLLYARKLSLDLKRRNDEIIEENQARLALAIRSSKIGFLDWDLEDNRIWISPELKAQLGYKDCEMADDYGAWIKSMHPEDGNRFVKEVQESITAQQSYFETEIRLFNKSGELLHFLLHLTILYKQGIASRILASNIDITDRKKEQLERERLLEINRVMFNEHDAIMLLVDAADGSVLDANPAASEFYGYSHQELCALNIRDINPFTEELVPKTIPLIMSKQKQRFTYTHFLKSGETRVVDIFSCPINFHGQPRFFSIIFDVTERENLKRDIVLEKEYLRKLIDYANASIITWTPDLTINEFNHAYEKLTGWRKEEVLGKQIDILFPKDQRDEITGKIKNTPVNKHWDNVEMPILTATGEVKTVLWNSAQITNSDGAAIATIAQGFDITERKQMEEKLIHLSYHDHLTEVHNRRFFEGMLEELDIESNLPITIIMGDINGLRYINDSLGHAEGDLALIRVAKTIKECCRSNDIVARIGGDEFGIILTNTDEAQARGIMRSIKDQWSEKCLKDRPVSITFGFSIKISQNKKLYEFVSEAENNLFKQKLYETTSVRHDIINIIMNALFEKSNREMMHSKRVSVISGVLASEMGLNREEINKIRIAGLVHDIGKIGISEKILNKPGKLDEDEWADIKKHPESGHRILASIVDFSDLAFYILHHHERWDGKGYPEGIKALEIPLESRIIALADAYDAMLGDRTYRKGMNKEEAILEIQRGSGMQFDPSIVDVFLKKVIVKETNFRDLY
jgi:diguanylate cyclase (GGDEF)-like protein/PAS domain S-box-containing protein